MYLLIRGQCMFRQIFIKGLKAFVPVVVTVALVIWVFSSIETFFGGFVQHFIPHKYYFRGLGILVGVVFIFFLGLIVNAWIVKAVYRLTERILGKVPFVKTVYNAIQDLVNFFGKEQNSNENQAVVFTFGNTKMLGFITRDDLKDLPNALGGEKDVLVYIPLSYQIGGFMLSVPKRDLTPIDMKVDQAMSLILSAGMIGTKESASAETKTLNR